MQVGPIPEDDSPDLTETEIAEALDVRSMENLIQSLRGVRCSTCGEVFDSSDHALRRRAPHLYWKMALYCETGHQTSLIFRTDWLKRG